MTLRLNGSTSGYTEIDAPAVAGSNTLVLPTGNGSAGNILGTDGAGNLSWVNGRMVLATAQNSTSGTSIDFTGIPSWVKRVTVMFNGVSTNGTSAILCQLGSGSFATTGYTSQVMTPQASAQSLGATSTAGFNFIAANAQTIVVYGCLTATLLSANTWVASYQLVTTIAAFGSWGTGAVTLSGALDRLRITTTNGTDTFDAGSINILYEG